MLVKRIIFLSWSIVMIPACKPRDSSLLNDDGVTSSDAANTTSDPQVALAMANLDDGIAELQSSATTTPTAELSLDDSAQVQQASTACLSCAFNAVWTALALLGAPFPVGAGSTIKGIAANASGQWGVIAGALDEVYQAANGNGTMSVQGTVAALTTIIQGVLLLLKNNLAKGLPIANQLAGLSNVVSTLTQCGFALTSGLGTLASLTSDTVSTVAAVMKYDVATPSAVDTRAVAYGRACAAQTTVWSMASRLNQCLDCCSLGFSQAAYSTDDQHNCNVPCNAKYK